MINLQDYGYNERIEADKMGLIPARVTEVHRNRYKVICQFGEGAATLKESLFNGIIQAEDLRVLQISIAENNRHFKKKGDYKHESI